MLHSFVLRDHYQMWVVELTDYPDYYNCGVNSITIMIFDRIKVILLIYTIHPGGF